MIRLPKKIQETIERELTQDYLVVKRVFIDSSCKVARTNLIVLRAGYNQRLVILRYWGDGSYSFLAGYNNMLEVKEELAYQVKKTL